MIENIRALSLVPCIWADGFSVELVEESDLYPWVYAIVCDCCGEIKYEGTYEQCNVWLSPTCVPIVYN